MDAAARPTWKAQTWIYGAGAMALLWLIAGACKC